MLTYLAVEWLGEQITCWSLDSYWHRNGSWSRTTSVAIHISPSYFFHRFSC